MFDLMYVNRQYSRQFAFMRKANRELLLVVANFDDVPVDMQLSVPAHAFDYLDMAEGDHQATDLFDGTSTTLHLQRDQPIGIGIGARGARILKIKF